MIYTQIANANEKKVAEAAMQIVSLFDQLDINKGEKVITLVALVKAIIQIHGFKPAEMFLMVSNMEAECIRRKLPEFPAAMRYIRNELT